MSACNAKYANATYTEDSKLILNDFDIAKDAVVLATPEMANLPYTVSPLAACKGLCSSVEHHNRAAVSMVA